MNRILNSKALIAVLALCGVSASAHAVQNLGEISTCRGTVQQVFLRTPGVLNSVRWTVTSSNPAVALFSTSAAGPFTSRISILVQYGNTGSETSTFYVQGVSSGTSLMTAEPDSLLQGRDIYTAILPVDRVSGIELVDGSDQPFEPNPAIGGGQRIFTDVPVSQVSRLFAVPDSQFDAARTVYVKVSLEGQNEGFPVTVRMFDVDDPTDESRDIDPNDIAGNDNIGRNAGPVLATGNSGSDGVARVPVPLSTQPGDNFRFAASCELPWLGGLEVNRTEVSEASGQAPNPDKGRVSDMLTVWRYLHLEVDTMGAVACNQLRGTVLAAKQVRGGRTQLKLGNVTDNCGDAFSLKEDTGQDEFIPGMLSVGGASLAVVNSRDQTITVNGLLPASVVGTIATLVDDDNTAGGALDGDELDAVPPPDLSLLQNSSDPASNVLAMAYVVPLADLPSARNPGIRINTPDGDVRVVYEYEWIAHDNDPNFWTAYVLGAYQGPDTADDDPETEGEMLGLTDFANTGSMVFAETIRDAMPAPAPVACTPRAVTAHEVIHLFDQGTKHLPDNYGLMSASCRTGDLALFDETIRTIREALHP